MSRHIDFRDDRDMAFGGIVDDIANLVLCIEAPVFLSVICSGVMADHGFLAFRSDLCQFRIFLDLDTPTLVIGQMPVERILVVQGKDIEIRFYRIHGEEMAADIQHHASIGKTGIVIDGSCR